MNASVRIVKMSGSGNDFVVLGAEEAAALAQDLTPWTRAVCRRGLSVGADGVIVVEPTGTDRVRMRFLNPDGGEAFCGNGTRCAARFARDRGYTAARLVLQTCAGDVPAEVRGAHVRLILPVPEDRGAVEIDGPGGPIAGRYVLAGAPHFVVPVADVNAWPLAEHGPWIRRHPAFGPAGVNVDVMADEGDGALRVRTWERGVEGETLSCGSGALACARVAMMEGRTGRLRIEPQSGIPLYVDLPEPGERQPKLIFEGDARRVFETTLDTESLAGTTGT